MEYNIYLLFQHSRREQEFCIAAEQPISVNIRQVLSEYYDSASGVRILHHAFNLEKTWNLEYKNDLKTILHLVGEDILILHMM